MRDQPQQSTTFIALGVAEVFPVGRHYIKDLGSKRTLITLVNSMIVCALQEALLEYLPVGLRLPGLVQWVLRYTPKVSRLIKQVTSFSADDPHFSHTRIVFLATCLKCDMFDTFLQSYFERLMECRWRPCFETSQSGELSWTPGPIRKLCQ